MEGMKELDKTANDCAEGLITRKEAFSAVRVQIFTNSDDGKSSDNCVFEKSFETLDNAINIALSEYEILKRKKMNK